MLNADQIILITHKFIFIILKFPGSRNVFSSRVPVAPNLDVSKALKINICELMIIPQKWISPSVSSINIHCRVLSSNAQCSSMKDFKC